jgi:(p)ppGpp synthase/HD superfamily hydrolase
MSDEFELLRKAVGVAARAHEGQKRKDRRTPYAAHPMRVCLTVALRFGVADLRVLAAAVLHDTLEDTTVDRDELIEQFGPELAAWVALLSKDKRLPEEEREAAYRRAIEAAPWQVKVIKLADLYDNLSDAEDGGDPAKVRAKARAMLPAIEKGLPDRYAAAATLVRQKWDK